MRAKVTVVDGHWATVVSSNLDLLRLLLAREVNVVVQDKAFAGQLRACLYEAVAHHGQRLDAAVYSQRAVS